MIERYSNPEISAIWSDQNKYSLWLEIELLAVEARMHRGEVPSDIPPQLRQRAQFDIPRILEIEQTTKHDVIAFLTNVAEYVGPESRYIHYGMTSSDVLDTCLAVQLRQSGLLLKKRLEELSVGLRERAREFKYTLQVGRTHGIHAEMTTFGLTFALWYEEAKRSIERLDRAIDSVSHGKISGAVGTFEHLDPSVEEYVCAHLDLKPEPVSTQVVQRDRHAEFMTTLAVIGSLCEKIATEVRHLQRSEVREAEEFFSKGQKGSSAMPHKRNPIVSERLCGMARMLRGYAMTALENNALWHERDISHSSVERVICPDATILLDYMLDQTTRLVQTLVVYPETMRENIGRTYGLVYSQTLLLDLVRRGKTREEAYALVQKSALEAWNSQRNFLETLAENQELQGLVSIEEIERLFAQQNSLFRSVDYIYRRCQIDQ